MCVCVGIGVCVCVGIGVCVCVYSEKKPADLTNRLSLDRGNQLVPEGCNRQEDRFRREHFDSLA